jgi:hypothetical protein
VPKGGAVGGEDCPAEGPAAFPRFSVGPFPTAPRRTLGTQANTGLSVLYAVANDLARLVERTHVPEARAKLLMLYGHHVLTLTQLAVGKTTNLTVKLEGQESLPRWADYPQDVRDKFELLADAATAAGLDVAGILGAKAIEA